jgi:hypothetical protein
MGLPEECHANDVWTKKVVPTLIAWLGCQNSPWFPAPERVLKALRTACEEFYVEEIVEKISFDQKDEPFCLVSKP